MRRTPPDRGVPIPLVRQRGVAVQREVEAIDAATIAPQAKEQRARHQAKGKAHRRAKRRR